MKTDTPTLNGKAWTVGLCVTCGAGHTLLDGLCWDCRHTPCAPHGIRQCDRCYQREILAGISAFNRR